MKLIIKHNNTKVEIHNDFKYNSYIDVKNFILESITKTISTANNSKK